MQFLGLFFAVFVAVMALFGSASATICAADLRSGGLPQNFANVQAMYRENGRGGRKCFF